MGKCCAEESRHAVKTEVCAVKAEVCAVKTEVCAVKTEVCAVKAESNVQSRLRTTCSQD